jgi:hypothetical protein
MLSFYQINYQNNIQNHLNINIMEDRLITLKNYETMVDAMFDQEVLRENNIESSINNEDSVDLMPMFGEINEGLRIVVFEKDFEEAIKILEEYKNSIDSQQSTFDS